MREGGRGRQSAVRDEKEAKEEERNKTVFLSLSSALSLPLYTHTHTHTHTVQQRCVSCTHPRGLLVRRAADEHGVVILDEALVGGDHLQRREGDRWAVCGRVRDVFPKKRRVCVCCVCRVCMCVRRGSEKEREEERSEATVAAVAKRMETV